jgi:hypothetical protein
MILTRQPKCEIESVFLLPSNKLAQIIIWRGLEKWQIPKSPWVSILKWSSFGRFGVPPWLKKPPYVIIWLYMIYCVQNPSSLNHFPWHQHWLQHWRLLGIPTMMGCSYFWYGLWKPKYGPWQQSFEIETNMYSSLCWILQWKSLAACGWLYTKKLECIVDGHWFSPVWKRSLKSQTSWPVLPSGKRANITMENHHF